MSKIQKHKKPNDYRCPTCGGRGYLVESKSGNYIECSNCAAIITYGEVTLKVEGSNASEVLQVANKLSEKVVMTKKQKKNNPWISGSFYLAGAIIIGVLFLVMARTVDIIVLPLVIIGTLLLVSIIGAFQLRQDESLSQKNFLSLMLLVFRQIPFIKPKDDKKK